MTVRSPAGHRPRTRAMLGVGLAALLALGGCAEDDPVAGGSPATPRVSPGPGAVPSDPETGEPVPGGTPVELPSGAAALPPPPPAPATRSGPLTAKSMPAPADIGPGWAFLVDDGGAEEGYRGNGTPMMARNTAEVARTLVPLGCSAGRPLPRPVHALETNYRHGPTGTRAVAVAVDFRTQAAARAFWNAYLRNLTACAAVKPRRPGQVKVLAKDSDSVVSLRVVEEGPGGTFRETAVLHRERAAFLAVPGPAVLTRTDLVDRFRSLLAR
jgi:hypothetical protein